jgi:hypothetical protein
LSEIAESGRLCDLRVDFYSLVLGLPLLFSMTERCSSIPSYSSFDSEHSFDLDELQEQINQITPPPTPPPDDSYTFPLSFDHLDDPVEERKPLLLAQYGACQSRMDLLNRLWDCDMTVEPKPSVERVKEWPPQDYDCTFRPPKIETLPISFSVSSYPGIATDAYQRMSEASKEYLDRPLTQAEKDLWITLESERLDEYELQAADWLDYDDVAPQIDQCLYESLDFFSEIVSLPAAIRNIRDSTLSIETEGRDWVLLAERVRKIGPTCLLRFLHMTFLDVCEEIQDIASQSPMVGLKDGKPQWPPLKVCTPSHGKAKSILEWVSQAEPMV